MTTQIETRIAGIPCIVTLDRMFVQKPLGPNCDSDWDCYGYTEIEFTVCDRRGRPAPWLERKMSDEDQSRIENELEIAATEEY